LVTERDAAAASLGKGLTAVYRAMRDGSFAGLRESHEVLDRAVLRAYGLPERLAEDEPGLLDRLLDLNEAAAADPDYHPFGP
jgi:hypothetical protein